MKWALVDNVVVVWPRWIVQRQSVAMCPKEPVPLSAVWEGRRTPKPLLLPLHRRVLGQSASNLDLHNLRAHVVLFTPGHDGIPRPH